jgi:hypothetical protein
MDLPLQKQIQQISLHPAGPDSKGRIGLECLSPGLLEEMGQSCYVNFSGLAVNTSFNLRTFNSKNS